MTRQEGAIVAVNDDGTYQVQKVTLMIFNFAVCHYRLSPSWRFFWEDLLTYLVRQSRISHCLIEIIARSALHVREPSNWTVCLSVNKFIDSLSVILGRRDLIFCLASEHHFLRRIFEIFENWESLPEAKILGILDFKMYLEMLVFNVKNSK